MADLLESQPFVSHTRGYSETGTQAVSTFDRSQTWSRLIDELLRIRRLTSNWDGEGASAPDPDCVDFAISWIQQSARVPRAMPPSHVVAGPGGEIFLIWQDEGFYLEAEITAPGEVEIMQRISGQSPQHWYERGIFYVPQ